MKVLVDGKEMELLTEFEDGEYEFDQELIDNLNTIDMEDTIKLTKEQLEEINSNELYE